MWNINCICKHVKGERGEKGRERDFKRERYKGIKKQKKGKQNPHVQKLSKSIRRLTLQVSECWCAGFTELPGLTLPPVSHWHGGEHVMKACPKQT